MNKLEKIILGSITIAIAFAACEKEEAVLSGIPSEPTGFYPENGAIIPGVSVQLNATGSSAENDSEVYYEYYVSTDKENLLEETSRNLTNLIPGTQYFWRVIPFTAVRSSDGEGTNLFGETSEVFTFYTLPSPLEGLESDNGENETQVILRWEEPANCNQVEITFSPASTDVAQPIIVPAGQDSCIIKDLLDYSSDTQAFIKYTFTVKASVQVGDKEMEIDAQIDEIPLNKTKNVRDADFNVYTCLQIGNQIWLRENLRTTRLNDGTELVEGVQYIVGSSSDIYGVYYAKQVLFDDLFNTQPGWRWTSYGPKNLAPKEFKVAMWDDWMQLFKTLGVPDSETKCDKWVIEEEYLFEEAEVAYKLKSDTGWPIVDGNNGNGFNTYTFSVMPGGYINLETKEELGVGQMASIFAACFDTAGAPHFAFRFEPKAKGVYKYLPHYKTVMSNIRCVKNID